MFKELIQKAYSVKEEGFIKHYREAFKNANGKVSISMLAGECVSILILVIVLVLVPQIGSAVSDNMPAVKSGSAWANYTTSGANTWGQVQPLITVAVIVCIIGLVLKVIYDLKRND